VHYRLAPRHCLSSRLIALTLALALLAVGRSAQADARTEAAAKALEAKAMQEDYLATDFDKALEKLNQAAAKCGERCSAVVKAQIKRDIGVVQVAKQNHEAAVGAFTEALKADPNIQLDPDTRTKEVDSAWSEAKKQAAAAAPASSGAGAAPPAGDFTMQPAPETLTHTPLAVFVEYSGSETLAKAVLKYKALGMNEWKTLEMKPMDKGWGAQIPCNDVIDGDVLYYVQGFNASNDPVATSGDRNNPFHTTAKRGFTGDIPHFPGKEPPKQCVDNGDCPPDFPGCKKPEAETPEGTLKDEGQDCEEDSECASDKCGEDKTCRGGVKSSGKRKRFWIGLAFAYDFVIIPGGNDVCRLTVQAIPAGPYDCTVNGSDFPSRASTAGYETLDIVQGESDSVSSGFGPGNFRILASFDYAPTTNVMVGLRLGYVGNTYNGSAASGGVEARTFGIPLDAELRGTYVFGKDPIGKKGAAFYGMVAAGISQYSAEVGVTAISKACPYPKGVGTAEQQAQCAAAPPPPPCPSNSTSCTTVAQAWATSGPVFASVGVGLRYGFTPEVALLFGPRFNLAIGPTILPSVSPELGIQYGF
jgi:hypothetical protein